jgi:HrpA-like RNA helicase
VLVTQPRRVAAVSLARRVAAERGCEVGGEVGYHIGQERRSSSSVTRLLFCTCGLLLEELRSNGLAVFEGHGAVVIDEVHERSVESDLCLAYIKTLLTSKSAHGCSTKFVLMSATFDSRRYKDFFSPVLERHLNVVAVADSVSDGLLQTSMLSIETRYLSDAVALVNDRLVPPACPAAFSVEVSEALKQAKPNLRVALQLIARLVSVLHEREERTDRHIMVFLPTYRSLEDCYTAVKGMHLPLDVHALHSSTDTEACIRAIECTQPGKRKLVLATNVAESSLTICDVAYIIDLCRYVCSPHRGMLN